MSALEERGDTAPLDAPCWLGLVRALAAADAPLACELAWQQQRALEAALAEAAQGPGLAAAAAPVAVLLLVGSTLDLSRATHDAVAAAGEDGGDDDEDRPLAAPRKAGREPAAAAPPRHEEWLRQQLEPSAGAAAAAAADAGGGGKGGGGKGGGGKGGDAARRGGVARLLRALTELAPVHLADELKLHARLAKQVKS